MQIMHGFGACVRACVRVCVLIALNLENIYICRTCSIISHFVHGVIWIV